MERIQPMNELQIQEKVEDLAGKTAKILDCEQNTLSQTEEVLLVNGIPISLVGEEGAKIKEALIHGEVPSCDLVNNMLIRAGIETNPVELETTVNVKSSVKTLEHYQLKDSKGVLVDEKMKEKEDEDEFRTVNVEIWSMEDEMLPPEENTKVTKIKAPPKEYKESANTSGSNNNNNKKSKFSPISIIKPNKSENSKQKQNKKSQQQIQQVDGDKSNTPSTTTPTVPKNKFLSLFSKGKTKDKTQVSDQQQLEHSSGSKATKDKNSSEPHSVKRNGKKTKATSVDNEKQNKQLDISPTKVETTKQNFNVNYLDPSKSLVHVEIDGIPVRVAYETFV